MLAGAATHQGCCLDNGMVSLLPFGESCTSRWVRGKAGAVYMLHSMCTYQAVKQSLLELFSIVSSFVSFLNVERFTLLTLFVDMETLTWEVRSVMMLHHHRPAQTRIHYHYYYSYFPFRNTRTKVFDKPYM